MYVSQFVHLSISAALLYLYIILHSFVYAIVHTSVIVSVCLFQRIATSFRVHMLLLYYASRLCHTLDVIAVLPGVFYSLLLCFSIYFNYISIHREEWNSPSGDLDFVGFTYLQLSVCIARIPSGKR